MKTLLISNALYGGAGKACHRLYTALRGRGEDVRLLYLDGRTSFDDHNVVPFYSSARDVFLRQILYLPWARLHSLRLGDARGQYRLPLSHYPLERHPLVKWADVINLHWVPELIDYPRFFRRLREKPVIWTLHDMLPFSGGYHWASELGMRDHKVEARIEGIKVKAVEDANLSITAPSSWLLNVSHNSRVFGGRRHRHIFNGLPMEVYKPIDKAVARQIFNLPQNKKIVLFVADNVHSARKGGHFLVEAFNALNDRNLVLVSIGRGRETLDGSLDRRHLGPLSDDVALSICYAAADVVVVPSLEENSPNIIIESIACGTPVVAFDVGGIGELMAVAGLQHIASPPSAASLASAIQQQLDAKNDPAALHARASEAFGLPVVGRQFTDLYREALES